MQYSGSRCEQIRSVLAVVTLCAYVAHQILCLSLCCSVYTYAHVRSIHCCRSSSWLSAYLYNIYGIYIEKLIPHRRTERIFFISAYYSANEANNITSTNDIGKACARISFNAYC